MQLLRDNNLDFSYLLDDLLADTNKLLLSSPVSTKAEKSSAVSAVTRPPRGGLPPPESTPPTPTSSSFPRSTTPKPVKPLSLSSKPAPPSPSRSISRPQ